MGSHSELPAGQDLRHALLPLDRHAPPVLAPLVLRGDAVRRPGGPVQAAGGPRVRPMPMHGCSAWQRGVGADDVAGPSVSDEAACQPMVLDQPMEVAWAP